jgi:hypothetical protein
VGDSQHVGHERRLADAGLPLDQHNARGAVADQGVGHQGEDVQLRPTADHLPGGLQPDHVRRRPDRPEHGHRLGLPLERHRRQRLPHEPVAGGPVRPLVAQHAALGRLHQPGGQVHRVPDDGELAPPVAADDAAEHPAGGHPDRPGPAEVGQPGVDGQGGGRAPGRVVLVGERRQPEGGHERHPLLVRAQLVHAPLEPVQLPLERRHHPLGGVERGLVRQPGEVDEQYGERPEFGQPAGLPGGQPAVDGGRDERDQSGDGGRGHGRRWQRLRLRRLAQLVEPDVPAGHRRAARPGRHPAPGGGPEHHLAGVGGRRGVRRLDHRWADHHQFPAVEHPADGDEGDRPGPDPGPERQLVPGCGGERGER